MAVMGQRLEPWSQALSRFKRTLENKFSRVRNSLGMLSPITATIESARFSARNHGAFQTVKSGRRWVDLLLVVRLRMEILYNG